MHDVKISMFLIFAFHQYPMLLIIWKRKAETIISSENEKISVIGWKKLQEEIQKKWLIEIWLVWFCVKLNYDFTVNIFILTLIFKLQYLIVSHFETGTHFFIINAVNCLQDI